MNKQADQKINSLVSLSAQELGLTSTCKTDVSFAIWVRALMQNWRQGTVSCKTRGEVSFSNRKPWKQKGTGRARAGSARSPLWRSGGVLFGPQPRVRTLKINKQNKTQVLSACLAEYADTGKLFSFDWSLGAGKPSTSSMHKALTGAGLAEKKMVMFLPRQDFVHWASVNNLGYVQVISFDDANAYELSLGNCVVVLKKDLDTFKNMVAKWN
jgi:large subunit ribosomal protein L4